MGEIKRIPFGDNLMEVSYSGLKGWYGGSINKPGAKGFFERVGKAIVVIPAHLLIATVQSLLMVIYDFVLALFFSMAALCTGFKKKQLNAQFLGHLGSLGSLPEKAFNNLAAAFCPPLFYKSHNIYNCNRAFANLLIKQLPERAWEAYQLGYWNGLSNNFLPDYYYNKFTDLEIVKSNILNKIKEFADKRLPNEANTFIDQIPASLLKDSRTKNEKALGRIPFGKNLMDASQATLQTWYEKSAAKRGAKGFFERTGKAIVLIPAHLLVATVQPLLIVIYDLAMALIFSLAAFLTGFKYYGINRQALGHIGSLTAIPGQSIKNAAAAIFTPPLSYRSDHIRNLQFAYQFGEVAAKEYPLILWENYRYAGKYGELDHEEILTNSNLQTRIFNAKGGIKGFHAEIDQRAKNLLAMLEEMSSTHSDPNSPLGQALPGLIEQAKAIENMV